ncbi:MAG: hypothetical protein ACI9KE_000024 [Polyangiales bacterium]|jgi:hypothetical protein
MIRGLVMLGLLGATLTSPAHAYTVGTAFTEPCHERLSAAAIEDFVERLPFEVPLLTEDRTRRVAAHFVELYGSPEMSPQAQAVLFAVIMGVRDPDSEGLSPTDLSGSRYLHANTEGQAQHALRRAEDDGPEGNAAAARGVRESIEAELIEAQNWFSRPLGEQTREVDYFLESYGPVRVRVWAPAFFLGRALHTLQDSFSHTLRTPDMRRLVHIFNYIEAIGDTHDDARDGLRHSGELDACYVGGASSSLFLAAREASTQLVEQVLDAPDAQLGDASAALDAWLGFEPGCTIENDYCNNAFLETARLKATAPIGTCGIGGDTAPQSGLFWAFLIAAFFIRRRSRRSRRSILVPIFLGALIFTGCKPTPLLQEEFDVTPPCGGDAGGVWYFAATSAAVPREEVSLECPLIRDDVRVLYSGRLDLVEDGSVDAGVSLRRHLIQVRDSSCDPLCESDPSCITRGDVCHCLDVTRGDWLSGQPGAPTQWATQEDTLELFDADGELVLATGYCVDDGEMEWASITSPSVGQRLQRVPGE